MMNRTDKVFIVVLVLLSVALYGTIRTMVISSTSDLKIAVVTYRDKEVLRIDMSKDGIYTVDGTLGDVIIEVENNRIRVKEETSPYHICSIQGWVEYVRIPIVCLPNHIMILIEAQTNEDDEDITVR
jgi:hypothetical protein